MLRRVLVSGLLAVAMIATSAPAMATSGSGQQVDGGPAATQATAVEPGALYADDVQSGEARWYSFEAGAGQVAGVTLTEPGSVEYDCCLDVTLYDPDYEQMTFGGSLSNSEGTAQTVRQESEEDGLEEAGTYYLEVRLDEDSAIRPVPYEFTVDLSGEAAQSPTPSPTAATDPAVEPTTDEAAQSDRPTAAAAASAGDGGTSTLLWVVVGLLGLLVVLLIAALAFLFTRLQGQQRGRS